MNETRGSVPAAYFAELYRQNADPWQMTTSRYEREKYQATIALLPPRNFRNTLEVGCSVGVLTRMLALRTAHLVAVDLDETPLARARQTCRDQTNVTFAKMVVPGRWPAGAFDLIVLSEVLYFLDRQDIAAVAARVDGCLDADGLVVLVNWLGPTQTACSGDTAADLFIAASAPAFVRCAARRTPQYRMDLLGRPSAEPHHGK